MKRRRGAAGKGEDLGDAALRHQHGAVLGGVQREGHGQHIGFGAGALRDAVDDVERVGGEAAREAAEQRHEPDLPSVDPRQVLDAGRQRAAVAEPDHGILPSLAGETQVAGAEHAEGAQRQEGVVEVGRDLAEGEAVGAAELLFELDAAGDLAVDEDPHHALAARAGDEPVRLDVGHVEPGRDLALRQPADVVQPRGSGRQAGFVFRRGVRIRRAAHDVLP